MSEPREVSTGLLEWELVVISFSSSFTSFEEAVAAVQIELGSVFRNGEDFDVCIDRIRELTLMGQKEMKHFSPLSKIELLNKLEILQQERTF